MFNYQITLLNSMWLDWDGLNMPGAHGTSMGQFREQRPQPHPTPKVSVFSTRVCNSYDKRRIKVNKKCKYFNKNLSSKAPDYMRRHFVCDVIFKVRQ